MNNSNYFEELLQLWLAHGGAPDETRDPEYKGKGQRRLWQLE